MCRKEGEGEDGERRSRLVPGTGEEEEERRGRERDILGQQEERKEGEDHVFPPIGRMEDRGGSSGICSPPLFSLKISC